MSLIEHVGLKMNVRQLKESSPGHILLKILKEWDAHMKAVTVRRFCDVCNELGILEVEQYMKKMEQGMDEGKLGGKEVELGVNEMKLKLPSQDDVRMRY